MLVESLGPAMAIMDESQLESDDEMGDDDDKENRIKYILYHIHILYKVSNGLNSVFCTEYILNVQ
jgi:hypothetical protein